MYHVFAVYRTKKVQMYRNKSVWKRNDNMITRNEQKNYEKKKKPTFKLITKESEN